MRVCSRWQSHSLRRNQAETTPGVFSEKTMEFRDVVSNVRGNHGLKFGGEFRREFNDNNLNGASRPLYTFASLFNFANDAPLFYQINADPGDGRSGQRTTSLPIKQLRVSSFRTIGKRDLT